MKRHWYAGFENKTAKIVAFYSNTEPTYDSFGHCYFAVIGPFKTKRAAIWFERYGNNNPHCYDVNAIEKIAKIYSK